MTTPQPPFPWVGLIAIAVAAFFSISLEMLPTGLLPEMGRDLGVGDSAVGLLVSVFAFTVVVTSTVLTHATSRIPRHRLLVLLIVVSAISAFGTAFAPTYGWMVATRVLGGLSHGVFWAIAGAYAAHLVPRPQVGRALAVSSSGGTLAFVLGVPLGTALGQAVGWRFAFGILAGLMLVGALLVQRLLPDVGSGAADAAEASDAAGGATPIGPGALATGAIPTVTHDQDGGAGSGSPPHRHPDGLPTPSVLGVVLTCVVTGLFMIGHYSFYTYVSPFLTRVGGIAESRLGVALFAYGIAGAVGLLLVGWRFGRRTAVSIPLSMGLAGASVLGLLSIEGQQAATFVLFVVLGLTFGALPPLLQTRLLEVAPARIRDLSSSFYASSFNAGIGLGALVGGLVLSTAGLTTLPVLYVAVAGVMLVVFVVADRAMARRRRALA